MGVKSCVTISKKASIMDEILPCDYFVTLATSDRSVVGNLPPIMYSLLIRYFLHRAV
jgi:hypothetical protein